MNKLGLFAYGEMGESVLRALSLEYTISWIILPPRELQTLTEKSTENYAQGKNIKIYYLNSLDEIYEHISSHKPDLIVIASLNKVLSEKIITLTKFVNIHLGDLPRYRGRANVNWAILNNRSHIGITMHEVIKELDAGNIYDQYLIEITHEDNVKTVYEKINLYLFNNVGIIAEKVLSGFEGTPQKGLNTYCCTRLPQDGLINWNNTSLELYNFIRGLTKPYPGAFTYFEASKMIIWNAEIPQKPRIYEGRIPGRIGSVIANYGVEVLTGDSTIIIKKIWYCGKEQNSWEVIKSINKTLGINWIELYENAMNIINKKT